MNIFTKLYGSFALRFLKDTVVYNYDRDCSKKIGRALLYFKTDVLFFPQLAEAYSHSNNWEVSQKIKILNRLGFVVDVIDRRVNISKLKLEDKYDLFIGIGAGDSGRYYPEIASSVPGAIKIFYACGPEPDFSDRITRERYDYFYSRNPNRKVKLRRTINEVNINRAMELTDVIFCIGNEFGLNSYSKFNKDIYRIYPSTSPKIKTDISQLKNRSPQKFLYFGGNGNIVKGLDLVIETFAQLPDLELYICAPTGEADFNTVYQETLKEAKNIHFIGFIEVGGETFDRVTADCAYTIFPSASEGTPDSVATVLRKGLIPVVTRAAGIDVGDFGYLIKDISIKGLKNQARELSTKNDIAKRSFKTYLESFKYTQKGFSESFETALIKTLEKKL